jgi:SAM-dependent methyltransferase
MVPPHLFDRALIARHLARRPAGADDFVTRIALDDLSERLATVTRTFERALILAPDAAPLPATGHSANGEFAFERRATVLDGLDPAAFALPHSDYDLIVSILDLQIIDDVPGFLARIRTHLRPDGLFLAAALGGDSLTELRQAFLKADTERLGGAYARVAPFIPVADVGRLLQRAGFALPVGDVETHVVRYATPLSLMQELKALGASNPLADRPGKPLTAAHLAAAIAHYQAIASDPDGRVRATLEIVWMSGWAPHESQQKPLRPGSAEVSLTKVLGRQPAVGPEPRRGGRTERMD